ncbi:hypothetical protein BDW74DRAFT_164878 [Aspergillus multicolor]|uniref:uncharacterized protein n=1 Tax=Aspergillus multicolor TaxID=41759 RepID=UPI003CCCC3E2
MYPWNALRSWAPFDIDALGLLTLLGANEVDISVGRLAHSYWLEYMPLLAGGIVTGNLAAWFTRWMQAQEFQVSRSLVYWEENRLAINRAVASARPFPTTYAGALDEWTEKLKKDPNLKTSRPLPDSRPWRPELAKILLIMPNSSAVTMFIPEHLLRGVFVTETPVRSPSIYRLTQWTGWVAFTVHVITLGMAQLATQLYVVALTVIPTVLICYGFGCDDSRINKGWRWLRGKEAQPYVHQAGPQLRATVMEWPEDAEFEKDSQGVLRRRDPGRMPRDKRSTARQDLYAWLDLTEEEQGSLWDWHLLPHKRGHDDSWWNIFEQKQRLIRERPLELEALKDRIQNDLEMRESGRRILRWGSRVLEDLEKGLKWS